MKKRKRRAAILCLGLLALLLTGAGEPEKPLEYFAVWDDESLQDVVFTDSTGKEYYPHELPEAEKRALELYENVIVVDNKGREYSLDQFDEEQRGDIHNYWTYTSPPTDRKVWSYGEETNIVRGEDNHWMLTDKEGTLIAEADGMSDCRFDSDNELLPIFRDAQTGLYGVLDEKLQVLLPATFSRVYALGGPYFSCYTETDGYVWNAETGETEWQLPEMPVKMAKTADWKGILFYNGLIAAVSYSRADAYLFRLTEKDPEKQAEYFYDIQKAISHYRKDFVGLTGFANGRVYLFDEEGRELFSVPNNSTGNLEYAGDGRYIVNDRYKDYIIDSKGTVIWEREREKYAYHSISSIPFGNMLHESYRLENFKGPIHNILSVDGEILVEGLSKIYVYGQTCLYVRKGFSSGLMDYNGNWIWKRSVFQKLTD